MNHDRPDDQAHSTKKSSPDDAREINERDEELHRAEAFTEVEAHTDAGVAAGEAQIPIGAVPGDSAAEQKTERREREASTGKHAFLVGAGILFSRIIGLVRQRIFASFFGLSDAGDAFNTAFRIPNFLQNVFGEGALSASFIPVYANLLARNDEKEAGRVAGAIFALLALITSLIVLFGVLATPYLIPFIAPGFKGEKRELTTQLVKIFFPGAGLLVLSAWCLGVLNSHRRFFLSYSAPVIWNVSIIIALLFFGNRIGQYPLAEMAAWGSVVGSGLQFGIQLPTVLSLIKHLRLSLDIISENVRKVARSFFPVFFSRGVVQISAFVDGILATLLGTGAANALAYTQSLYTLPVSLFGMSVSAAELPQMASAIGTTEEIAAHLRKRLDAGLRQIAFFIVPSAVGFLALGDVMIGVLYQTGKFTRADTLYVWGILAGSSVGLLASTLGRLYSSTYYALHDTRSPLLFAVSRVLLGIVLGYTLAILLPPVIGIDRRWGIIGLTIASGLAGWVEFFLLRRTLNKRIGRTGLPLGFTIKLWLTALTCAGLALGIKYFLGARHPAIVAALVLLPYGLLYFALTSLLGIGEAQSVVKRFTRILKRS
ncbi:MAG: murein biosynthesis integral membrane protein MurJ [Pyrinomonadaceae bacterium]|nr:murein biosynthesis integral membrane protein MurJ [Pyrinomonadaceae bacterium]